MRTSVILLIAALVLQAGCHELLPFHRGLRPAPDSGDAWRVTDAPHGADRRTGDCSSCFFFTDGFEGGLNPLWSVYTKPGDNVSIASNIGHTGAKSARCETNNQKEQTAIVVHDFQPVSKLYARFWVYLADGFGTLSGYVDLGRIGYAASSTSIAIVGINAARQPVIKSVASKATYTASFGTLAIGAWQKIELWIEVAGPSGKASLWIGNELVADPPAVDFGSLDISRAQFGIAWQGNDTEPVVVYVDDVALGDSLLR